MLHQFNPIPCRPPVHWKNFWWTVDENMFTYVMKSRIEEHVFSKKLISVIENAQRHFQGSLFGCFEYVPFTALTIVCTINVSIDCNSFDVSNPFTRKIILK